MPGASSNRAGVRHYFDGSDPTKGVDTQYDWQTTAAGLFAADPLNFAPGTSYGYSTHGYTLLGAAMEGELGDPASEILWERLSQPHGLPTLRAEDRSVPNAHRATLYTGTDSGPETVLTKGQFFYEAPGQLHAVSRNASDSEPAKVLVVTVTETGKPVTVPEKP